MFLAGTLPKLSVLGNAARSLGTRRRKPPFERRLGFGLRKPPYPFSRSSVPISGRRRRRSCNFISEKFSQPAFETHFSRRPPLGFEPPFEILHTNLVLNLGLSDDNRNRRLAAAHFLDPIVFAKHP
jgi:hypothetical protein